ncbi:apical membrane related protein [Cyclospora cayetanensis]|uniref:Cilia- and flagella-associated protein 206 n=1 Tax=Cyclospora cayetanensis TaxID=88456 RepID=A0A1D3D3Q2_9EIME|nr:apical membrane related protein [Cyclospora cayetanensis]
MIVRKERDVDVSQETAGSGTSPEEAEENKSSNTRGLVQSSMLFSPTANQRYIHPLPGGPQGFMHSPTESEELESSRKQIVDLSTPLAEDLFEWETRTCDPPYYLQAERQALKTHPEVVSALEDTWSLFSKDDQNRVPQAEYTRVLLRLCLVLVPELRGRQVVDLIETEWQHDSKGEDALSREAFFESFFELADIWTPGIEGHAYADFLRRLFRRITVKRNGQRDGAKEPKLVPKIVVKVLNKGVTKPENQDHEQDDIQQVKLVVGSAADGTCIAEWSKAEHKALEALVVAHINGEEDLESIELKEEVSYRCVESSASEPLCTEWADPANIAPIGAAARAFLASVFSIALKAVIQAKQQQPNNCIASSSSHANHASARHQEESLQETKELVTAEPSSPSLLQSPRIRQHFAYYNSKSDLPLRISGVSQEELRKFNSIGLPVQMEEDSQSVLFQDLRSFSGKEISIDEIKKMLTSSEETKPPQLAASVDSGLERETVSELQSKQESVLKAEAEPEVEQEPGSHSQPHEQRDKPLDVDSDSQINHEARIQKDIHISAESTTVQEPPGAATGEGTLVEKSPIVTEDATSVQLRKADANHRSRPLRHGGLSRAPSAPQSSKVPSCGEAQGPVQMEFENNELVSTEGLVKDPWPKDYLQPETTLEYKPAVEQEELAFACEPKQAILLIGPNTPGRISTLGALQDQSFFTHAFGQARGARVPILEALLLTLEFMASKRSRTAGYVLELPSGFEQDINFFLRHLRDLSGRRRLNWPALLLRHAHICEQRKGCLTGDVHPAAHQSRPSQRNFTAPPNGVFSQDSSVESNKAKPGSETQHSVSETAEGIVSSLGISSDSGPLQIAGGTSIEVSSLDNIQVNGMKHAVDGPIDDRQHTDSDTRYPPLVPKEARTVEKGRIEDKLSECCLDLEPLPAEHSAVPVNAKGHKEREQAGGILNRNCDMQGASTENFPGAGTDKSKIAQPKETTADVARHVENPLSADAEPYVETAEFPPRSSKQVHNAGANNLSDKINARSWPLHAGSIVNETNGGAGSDERSDHLALLTEYGGSGACSSSSCDWDAEADSVMKAAAKGPMQPQPNPLVDAFPGRAVFLHINPGDKSLTSMVDTSNGIVPDEFRTDGTVEGTADIENDESMDFSDRKDLLEELRKTWPPDFDGLSNPSQAASELADSSEYESLTSSLLLQNMLQLLGPERVVFFPLGEDHGQDGTASLEQQVIMAGPRDSAALEFLKVRLIGEVASPVPGAADVQNLSELLERSDSSQDRVGDEDNEENELRGGQVPEGDTDVINSTNESATNADEIDTESLSEADATAVKSSKVIVSSKRGPMVDDIWGQPQLDSQACSQNVLLKDANASENTFSDLVNTDDYSKGQDQQEGLHSTEPLADFSQLLQRRWTSWGRCCPVTLQEEGKAVEGQTRYAVEFSGRLFLTADEEKYEKFLRDPKRYVGSPPSLPPTTCVYLFGPSYAGASKQAKMLSQTYGFVAVDVSKELEEGYRRVVKERQDPLQKQEHESEEQVPANPLEKQCLAEQEATIHMHVEYSHERLATDLEALKALQNADKPIDGGTVATQGPRSPANSSQHSFSSAGASTSGHANSFREQQTPRGFTETEESPFSHQSSGTRETFFTLSENEVQQLQEGQALGDDTVARLIVHLLGVEENLKRADAIDKYRADTEEYESKTALGDPWWLAQHYGQPSSSAKDEVDLTDEMNEEKADADTSAEGTGYIKEVPPPPPTAPPPLLKLTKGCVLVHLPPTQTFLEQMARLGIVFDHLIHLTNNPQDVAEAETAGATQYAFTNFDTTFEDDMEHPEVNLAEHELEKEADEALVLDIDMRPRKIEALLSDSLKHRRIRQLVDPFLLKPDPPECVTDPPYLAEIYSRIEQITSFEHPPEGEEWETASKSFPFLPPLPLVLYGDFGEYCPVALRDERWLLPGKPQLSLQVRQRVYNFFDEEKKYRFAADTPRYLPLFGKCNDTCETGNVEVPPPRIAFLGSPGSEVEKHLVHLSKLYAVPILDLPSAFSKAFKSELLVRWRQAKQKALEAPESLLGNGQRTDDKNEHALRQLSSLTRSNVFDADDDELKQAWLSMQQETQQTIYLEALRSVLHTEIGPTFIHAGVAENPLFPHEGAALGVDETESSINIGDVMDKAGRLPDCVVIFLCTDEVALSRCLDLKKFSSEAESAEQRQNSTRKQSQTNGENAFSAGPFAYESSGSEASDFGDGEEGPTSVLSSLTKARKAFLEEKAARDAVLLQSAKSFAMARVPILTVRSELCEGTLFAAVTHFLERFMNHRKSLILSSQCIPLPKSFYQKLLHARVARLSKYQICSPMDVDAMFRVRAPQQRETALQDMCKRFLTEARLQPHAAYAASWQLVSALKRPGKGVFYLMDGVLRALTERMISTGDSHPLCDKELGDEISSLELAQSQENWTDYNEADSKGAGACQGMHESPPHRGKHDCPPKKSVSPPAEALEGIRQQIDIVFVFEPTQDDPLVEGRATHDGGPQLPKCSAATARLFHLHGDDRDIILHPELAAERRLRQEEAVKQQVEEFRSLGVRIVTVPAGKSAWMQFDVVQREIEPGDYLQQRLPDLLPRRLRPDEVEDSNALAALELRGYCPVTLGKMRAPLPLGTQRLTYAPLPSKLTPVQRLGHPPRTLASIAQAARERCMQQARAHGYPDNPLMAEEGIAELRDQLKDAQTYIEVSSLDVIIQALSFAGEKRLLHPQYNQISSTVRLVAHFIRAKNPLIDGKAKTESEVALDAFVKDCGALGFWTSDCETPLQARRAILHLHCHKAEKGECYLPPEELKVYSAETEETHGKQWTYLSEQMYSRVKFVSSRPWNPNNSPGEVSSGITTHSDRHRLAAPPHHYPRLHEQTANKPGTWQCEKMGYTREASGYQRMRLTAMAALYVAGSIAVQAEENPWGDSMQKFNIPYAHGSGVYVDLGNSKTVNNKWYREPAGRCPVMGKVINLLQPTTDKNIWPRDYLERVPTKGSQQDTTPLGGGFAMWETTPTNISPLTLEELQSMAERQRAKNTPNELATKMLESVVDNHGLCAWWSWVTFASNSSNNLDDKYRYPFVWQEDKQTCTLLAVAMQLLEGNGTYCTAGDESPQLTWYCFHPEKSSSAVSYNSPYVRTDHATACPEKPINGAHFGVWNGSSCARIIPRLRKKVSEPSECGKAVFIASPSDNPTKYTQGPDTQGVREEYQSGVVTTWPVGSPSADQPRSRGVGINYANWYSDGYCELYDAVPNCFTKANGQLSFTSLGSIDPETAELPPCTAASEGWELSVYCSCGNGEVIPWKCKNVLGAALGIGIGVLIPILAISGYFLYKRSQNKNQQTPEKKRLLSTDSDKNEEFMKSGQREKHKQSDLVQEAEQSFWGETGQDQTNVVVDGAPQEAFY